MPLAAKCGVGIRHDAQRAEQHEQNLCGVYSLCVVQVSCMSCTRCRRITTYSYYLLPATTIPTTHYLLPTTTYYSILTRAQRASSPPSSSVSVLPSGFSSPPLGFGSAGWRGGDEGGGSEGGGDGSGGGGGEGGEGGEGGGSGEAALTMASSATVAAATAAWSSGK